MSKILFTLLAAGSNEPIATCTFDATSSRRPDGAVEIGTPLSGCSPTNLPIPGVKANAIIWSKPTLEACSLRRVITGTPYDSERVFLLMTNTIEWKDWEIEVDSQPEIHRNRVSEFMWAMVDFTQGAGKIHLRCLGYVITYELTG